MPEIPVDPNWVLIVFQHRWRAKNTEPSSWRIRGLAVIAVAMSLPVGTTVQAMCAMRPAEILQLRMPLRAWRWVARWLWIRREVLGAASDHQPWLSFLKSRGMPRQVGWAAVRTFERARIPGWRVNKLLRAGWHPHQRPVPFGRVARRLRSFIPEGGWALSTEMSA